MATIATNILDMGATNCSSLLHFLARGSSGCFVIALRSKSEKGTLAKDTAECLCLDARLMPDRQSLVSRYGLTVGEAALAMKLAAGKSLQEAAEELLISDQAARMRLQRILMKSEEQDRSPFIMKLSLTRL